MPLTYFHDQTKCNFWLPTFLWLFWKFTDKNIIFHHENQISLWHWKTKLWTVKTANPFTCFGEYSHEGWRNFDQGIWAFFGKEFLNRSQISHNPNNSVDSFETEQVVWHLCNFIIKFVVLFTIKSSFVLKQEAWSEFCWCNRQVPTIYRRTIWLKPNTFTYNQLSEWTFHSKSAIRGFTLEINDLNMMVVSNGS